MRYECDIGQKLLKTYVSFLCDGNYGSGVVYAVYYSNYCVGVDPEACSDCVICLDVGEGVRRKRTLRNAIHNDINNVVASTRRYSKGLISAIVDAYRPTRTNRSISTSRNRNSRIQRAHRNRQR